MHCLDLGESFQTHIYWQKFGFDTAENEPCQFCPIERCSQGARSSLPGDGAGLAVQQRAELDLPAAERLDRDRREGPEGDGHGPGGCCWREAREKVANRIEEE